MGEAIKLNGSAITIDEIPKMVNSKDDTGVVGWKISLSSS